MFGKLIGFFRKDIVLLLSMLLAVGSCFVVPPSVQYLSYLDWKTLGLLFCLMLIVEGLREQNVFQALANRILSRVNTKKGLVCTLVFLCFISSMFITNDVALITFVPFGIMLLEMAELVPKLCLTVTLMTIAGNLGSMFTPIGNPQNLYLFSRSGLDIGGFLTLMLPYTALAAILLVLFILLGYRQSALSIQLEKVTLAGGGSIILYLLLFLLCIAATVGMLHPLLLVAIVSVGIFYRDRSLFAKVDYSLLLTFVFFFIFTGNLNHLEGLRASILGILEGRGRIVSIGLSQVISNVPAAMLLSGYTDATEELIVGTNLGGLGTLIASMASLISYKQISNRYPQCKKRYLLTFTLCNVIFLLFLCLW